MYDLLELVEPTSPKGRRIPGQVTARQTLIRGHIVVKMFFYLIQTFLRVEGHVKCTLLLYCG